MMTYATLPRARRLLADRRAERIRPAIDPATARAAAHLVDLWREDGMPFPAGTPALVAGLAHCALSSIGGAAIARPTNAAGAITGAEIVAAYIEDAARHDGTPVRLWRLAWTAAGRTCRRYAQEPAETPRTAPLALLTRQAMRLSDRLYSLAVS